MSNIKYKYSKWDKINKSRERKRSEQKTQPIQILPNKRREIMIINHDFGTVEHHFECYKTNRIDCFKVTVNGKLWKEKIGWSKILEGIRLSIPPVQSPYSI